jgi:LmbE family N-acetylglucosaminyl deacetylase
MVETTSLNGAKRVMAVFAHPDDPEFFCGGTLARWAAEGAQVVFVMATSGDKGSADPEMTHERLVTIREEEERNAARALGVNEVIFLRYPDGELQPTLELRRDLTRLIRLKQPDIVVTCDPTVFWYGTDYLNHPDHRAIGAATLEAVFPTARDRLNFIELERDEGLATHKVDRVYITGASQPTTKVDVTDFIETKINSLREHKSQISDMDALAERIRSARDPESPEEYPRYVESFRVITFSR